MYDQSAYDQNEFAYDQSSISVCSSQIPYFTKYSDALTSQHTCPSVTCPKILI